MIGLEDFIAMKVFAGGRQDLADARAAINAGSSALHSRSSGDLRTGTAPAAAAGLEKLLADASAVFRLGK